MKEKTFNINTCLGYKRLYSYFKPEIKDGAQIYAAWCKVYTYDYYGNLVDIKEDPTGFYWYIPVDPPPFWRRIIRAIFRC